MSEDTFKVLMCGHFKRLAKHIDNCDDNQALKFTQAALNLMQACRIALEVGLANEPNQSAGGGLSGDAFVMKVGGVPDFGVGGGGGASGGGGGAGGGRPYAYLIDLAYADACRRLRYAAAGSCPDGKGCPPSIESVLSDLIFTITGDRRYANTSGGGGGC